ncbi:VanZ family protein [Anaerobacillus sp. CMMVII]|uniref:VanZ family protein n=1 Tax=Anaerobacillus sp. CMMVII TaxID=2755588 RepID=UPI0021B7867F|nr:VanZ family protein [Anaerobacillus sp. CMMVII]MCT8136716.1 VanZ family protein [Anaerobacillus sp. CMMVII]
MKNTVTLSFVYSQIVFFLFLPVWLEITKYLHTLVIGVIWFCITTFVFFIVCWIKKETVTIPPIVLHIITLLYAFGLFVLLFFRPQNQNYGTINLIPFETIVFYLSGQVDYLIALYNLSANIGLFIPFGLYYGYIKGRSRLKQLLVIAIFSVCLIEILQFLTRRGSLDIDDLILNVLGVLLGYLIYPQFQKVLKTM